MPHRAAYFSYPKKYTSVRLKSLCGAHRSSQGHYKQEQ
nr:MAG TPA: hypothetical protein [Caudoviricetes sp.]